MQKMSQLEPVICNLDAVWHAWAAALEEKQRIGRLLACAVHRRSRALLKMAVSGWRAVLHDRQAFRHHLQSIGDRADAALLARSFNSWLEYQQMQQVQKNLCYRNWPVNHTGA